MKLLTFLEARQAILAGIPVIILEIETRERLTEVATLSDLKAILAEDRQADVRLYANV